MNDDHLLKNFDQLVTRLNETPGTNAKIDILKEHGDLRPLIKRIWDPDTKTHVTLKGLTTWRKKKDGDVTEYCERADYNDLYTLFDGLTSGKISGDRAKAAVWCYVARHPKYEDLILRIAEKNPRIRLAEKTILQAFPGIFTIFKVCLSDEWTEKDFQKAYDATGQAWISKKIDGMRLITKITAATAERAQVRFYSRKGKEVTSLEVLRKDLMQHFIPHLDAAEIADGLVLDGEVVALNPDGSENFKLTISEARKKDVNMPSPRYKLFDILPLPVFEERARGEKFGNRLENLRDFATCLPKRCEILEQTPWSREEFARLQKEAREKGFEGLMIRMNAYYEAKRTRNLLKWKIMCQDEFRVDDVIIDEQYPVPNKQGGEDRVRALAAVVIHHKKGRVQCGSGFDRAERLDFAEHPDRILGKIISVKYQEEFYDEVKKQYSLRCPIYQGIVGDDEREV